MSVIVQFFFIIQLWSLLLAGDTDDDKIEIPLHCYGLRGDIQFDTHCDFGPQVVAENTVKMITLHNEGLGEGPFQFLTDESSCLKFTPASGILFSLLIINRTFLSTPLTMFECFICRCRCHPAKKRKGQHSHGQG